MSSCVKESGDYSLLIECKRHDRCMQSISPFPTSFMACKLQGWPYLKGGPPHISFTYIYIYVITFYRTYYRRYNIHLDALDIRGDEFE